MVDVISIKNKVAKSYENEMTNLLKSYNDKIELETRKAKKEVVTEVLDELLNDTNITITKDNLQNIISKKVA